MNTQNTQQQREGHPEKRPFNRYEILSRHYAEKIARQWSFDAIKKECIANAQYDPESDSRIGYCYLGSHLSIAPSGKFYMPWTTNQTHSDVIRDECFWSEFEKALEQHGMFLGGPDSGDGLDVFAGMVIDDDDDENNNDD